MSRSIGTTKALIGSGPQWASVLPLFTVSLLRYLRGRRAERRVEALGRFRVRGRLTGPTSRSEDAGLLVDTGATLLVVPRALAERLDLVTGRSQPVLIAGVQRAAWPVAEVDLSLNGPDVTTPCFIAPDGPALLGAVALESLFLAVHPVAKRLLRVSNVKPVLGDGGPGCRVTARTSRGVSRRSCQGAMIRRGRLSDTARRCAGSGRSRRGPPASRDEPDRHPPLRTRAPAGCGISPS